MGVRETFHRYRDPLYLLLLSIIFLGCYYYSFDYKVFLGGDNVYYYNLGKALAEGKGYVTLNRPGLPLASHYPPGYPAIIAIVMTLFSQSILTIKMLNGFLLFGSIMVCYYLFKRLSANSHIAFLVSTLLILNSVILKYSSIMMSEIPFLFFSLLTLLIFLKTDRDISPFRQSYFYIFIFCLAIAYYIKTVGIALLGGFILYFLFYRRWRWVLSTVVGFVVLALPWTIRNRLAGGGSYVHQLLMVNPYRPELGMAGLSDFAIRFWSNFQRYVAVEIPNGLFPSLKNSISAYGFTSWIIGITICLLIVFGIYKLKKYSILIGAYFISTFGILLLWPQVWFGVRFIVPIIPLLFFCFLFGFHQFLNLLFHKFGRSSFWHPLYLLIFAIAFIPGLNQRNHQARTSYPINWYTYIQMAKWTKKNTPQDAIISCRKPAIFYLFSNRKTFRFKDTPDNKKLLQDLKKHGTDYVVLDQLGFSSTPRYLFPALKKYRNHFKTVLRGTKTKTYLLKFQSDTTHHE